MVNTFVFQPTLLDCWACRDLKRFRQVLRGGGGLVLTHSQPLDNNGNGVGKTTPGPSSLGKDGGLTSSAGNILSTSQGKSPGNGIVQSLGSAAANAFNGPCSATEVNRRDYFGRTVLHLVSASTEPVSIDYLTALLGHPQINVNLQDHENGWTALHRALYHGNLLTALTLLKRLPPADIRVKDFEGLTPFDLYNSTIHGTSPPNNSSDGLAGELFTWGANRNYTLGSGTSDDRSLPDRVVLRRNGIDETNGNMERKKSKLEAGNKFDKVQVCDIGMSKFATIVLTAESSSNVWVCGIGNTGRIGRAPQTQTNLEPLRDFNEKATAIAVGPDHTCILTSKGDVFTFGFNKFQQLGYVLEQGQGIVSSSAKGGGGAASTTFGGPSPSNSSLDIQISPRKVAGNLKKERVVGIAAGKLHSAAFTSDSLYTWGTNTGQLGYDRAATPSQIVPRKVTAITASMSIESIAITDFATACLLSSGDVLLLHNDTSFFVRFPQLTFSSQTSVYRPRQARPKPSIRKIASGPNNAIAAISDIGDLWQFTPEHPSEYSQSSGNSTTAKANIKPQLIWSVRKNKKVGAARDVGIGSGQDLILVTESGHVFVRSRKGGVDTFGTTQLINNLSTTNNATANTPTMTSSGQPSVKGKSGWKPVPYLQRVFRVATNESGGLAAIKIDAKMREIRIRSRTLQEDLRDVLPHLKAPSTDEKEGHDIVGDLAEALTNDMNAIDGIIENEIDDVASSSDEEDEADERGDLVVHHIFQAQTIAEAARRWIANQEHQLLSISHKLKDRLPLGCDMYLIAGGRYLPAHRAIVSARIPSLTNLLSNPLKNERNNQSIPLGIVIQHETDDYTTMTLTNCSFGAALFFLHYIYTDGIPPIWTSSVGMKVDEEFGSLNMSSLQIRSELRQLIDTLNLTDLNFTLDSSVPMAPKPRLSEDMTRFFLDHVDVPIEKSSFHDVELQLSDRVVPCHSFILRRSSFFSALFQPHWTSNRWNESGVLNIDMSHIRWEVARIVLMFLYTDKMQELFYRSDSDRTQDQFIDFIIEVLAFSNEILLEKYKAVCCSLLRRRIVPSNVAALLTDADFYHIPAFKESIMEYAARTMETLLEAGMLDDLENRMIRDLTKYVRKKQDERLHRTRAAEYLANLIVKHNDFYFDLDIPAPSLGIAAARVPKRQSRQSESRLSPCMDAAINVRSPKNIPRSLRMSSSPAPSPDLKSAQSDIGNLTATTNNDGSLMFSMDDDVDYDESIGGEGKSGSRFTLPPPVSSSSPLINTNRVGSNSPSLPWKYRATDANNGQNKFSQSPLSRSPITQDLRSIMASERSSTPKKSLQSGMNGWTNSPTQRTISSSLQQKTPFQSQSHLASTSQNVDAKMAIEPSPQPSEQHSIPLTAFVKMSQKDRKRQQMQQQQKKVQGGLSSSAPRNEIGAFHSSNTIATPPLTPSSINKSSSSFSNSPWKVIGGGGGGQQPSGISIPSTPLRPSLQTSSTMSLAEIQAEELRKLQDLAAHQQKVPKSFAELQEEDRRDNERRAKEEQERKAFESWFEEESKRVRKDELNQRKARNDGNGGGGNNQKKTGGVGKGNGKKQQKVKIGQGGGTISKGNAATNINDERRGGGGDDNRAGQHIENSSMATEGREQIGGGGRKGKKSNQNPP